MGFKGAILKVISHNYYGSIQRGADKNDMCKEK